MKKNVAHATKQWHARQEIAHGQEAEIGKESMRFSRRGGSDSCFNF
jgi:hypothetical protein